MALPAVLAMWVLAALLLVLLALALVLAASLEILPDPLFLPDLLLAVPLSCHAMLPELLHW